MNINRRQFLSSGVKVVAGLGTAAVGSGFSLPSAADMQDYKALVCINLQGGMDCHDTVLPYSEGAYQRYAEIRSGLIKQYTDGSRLRENLLNLIHEDSSGSVSDSGYALPIQLKELKDLYQNNRMAIVGNVGNLMEITDRQKFTDKSVTLPLGLFAHNHQVSLSHNFGSPLGWGGRLLDYLSYQGANQGGSQFGSISLGGSPKILVSEEYRPLVLSNGRLVTVNALNEQSAMSTSTKEMLKAYFRDSREESDNVFAQDIMAANAQSVDVNLLFNEVVASNILQTTIPNTHLGNQLRRVAEIIAARQALGLNRQIFYVNLGGWDSHNNQAENFMARQVHLSQAMAAFYQATEELGVADQVTAFTLSEFGRSLIADNNGTHHGWGGHHFVMGGAVKGGKIYGRIPEYDFGHDQEVGQGRLIPTTSFEQYAAPLARWFGAPMSEIETIMPNVTRFDPFATEFV